MKDAEIHEGDLLAVDKQMEADHNHIVVAVVEGECTIKYSCESNSVVLGTNISNQVGNLLSQGVGRFVCRRREPVMLQKRQRISMRLSSGE